MYNAIRPEPEWLDIAVHGATFLKKYGMDNNGQWYFSLNREGGPLIQPYNIFSDCFAAMAFGQIYQSTGEGEYRRIAQDTFQNILSRQENRKGSFSKSHPVTRPLKSFALPMILCNLVLELEDVFEQDVVESTIEEGVQQVMEVFYQPDILGGVILENVTPEGKFSNSFEGRLLNPGHILEVMWCVMDLATRKNDAKMIRKARDISLNILDLGWDKKYGGLYYFLDVKDYPPQQLGWDKKYGGCISKRWLPPDRSGGNVGMVSETAPYILKNISQIQKMVSGFWLFEPTGRSVAALKRGQVERLFPCSTRTVSNIYSFRKVGTTEIINESAQEATFDGPLFARDN